MFEYILLVIVLILGIASYNLLSDLRNRVFWLTRSVERLLRETEAPDSARQPAPAQPETNPAPVSLPAEASARCQETPADHEKVRKPAPVSAVPPRPQPEIRAKQSSGRNIEKYIGTQLFAAIGIAVLILGVGFFIKYAINNGWLDERMRTLLGYLCGCLLLGIAFRLRSRYRSFGSVLAGGAFALFYVTTAVAYHYYGLFPQSLAFGLLVLVTVLTAAIAAGYDRRELAVVALAGGLVAPLLTSGSQGNHLMLFGYLTVLHSGMFVLALRKKWWELPVISFAATYAIFHLFVRNLFLDDTFDPAVARHAFGFATLFYLLFAAAAAAVLRAQNSRFHWLLAGLVALNNFFFLRFGLLFLHRTAPACSIDGLVPLFIAAVNAVSLLAGRRHLAAAPGLRRLLTSLAVLFVTLAAPVQFRANAFLLCWAAEIVVLLWLYARSRQSVYEIAAALLSLPTVATAIVLWFMPRHDLFRSSAFLTVLCVAAAFAYTAWFTGRQRAVFAHAKLLRYPAANVLSILVAGFLFYGTFCADIAHLLTGPLSVQAWLLCSVGTIAVMTAALHRRFPVGRHPWIHIGGGSLAVLLFLIFSTSDRTQPLPTVLSWISTGTVALLLAGIALGYYRQAGDGEHRGFLVWLNIAATLVWIAAFCHLLALSGLHRTFSTGFSLALISAATLQIGLGMLRRQKTLRMLALTGFGIVLFKLLVYDLWQWPTLGRIVVFIALGIILLSLSFLYQRLRTALFHNEEPLHAEEK